MKHVLLIALLSLTGCQSSADAERLGRLADLAITYAAGRGAISPADANAIREAGTILLPAPATLGSAAP